MALRSLAAAQLVFVIAYWRGVKLADFRADLSPGLLVGLGFTSEFAFVA